MPHSTTKAIVALEGLDGTGKTFMARMLCERHGGMCVSTPGQQYAALRQRLHGNRGVASLLMYLTACADVSEQFLASDRSLLFVDRFWLSSVMHHARNTNASDEAIADTIHAAARFLSFPVLTVALRCARHVRRERLGARGEAGLGPTDELYERTWFRSLECFRHNLPPGTRILDADSSDGDEERIASDIASVLSVIHAA